MTSATSRKTQDGGFVWFYDPSRRYITHYSRVHTAILTPAIPNPNPIVSIASVGKAGAPIILLVRQHLTWKTQSWLCFGDRVRGSLQSSGDSIRN